MSHVHSAKKTKDREKEKKRKHSHDRHKDSKPKDSNFSKEEENGSSKYPPSNQEELRAVLLEFMCSKRFEFPIDAHNLFKIVKDEYREVENYKQIMKNLKIDCILQELQEKKAVTLEKQSMGVHQVDFIMEINNDKLNQLKREYFKDKPKSLHVTEEEIRSMSPQKKIKPNPLTKLKEFDYSKKITALQKELLEQTEEKINLMGIVTTTEKETQEKFRSKTTKKIDYCEFGTREKCSQNRMGLLCGKVHFRKLIRPHTDPSLGNCSYLDTCRHMDYCKFIHYELEDVLDANMSMKPYGSSNDLSKFGFPSEQTERMPAQWICTDLRLFDLRVIGKFDVLMCDPPWDIHMSLPYGTLKDKEMKALRIDILQDDGLIFLWVTGRAMELARECLAQWGYKRVEELIWIKTNQLQRIIRTGRTGHWLNHSKEHCLIGIKGNPKINKNVDCDVIVSEVPFILKKKIFIIQEKVRETSRKPDEIYNLIERMSPGGKKLELFGRPHNCREGWLTLGNQVPGNYIKDPEILKRFKETYPDELLSEEVMEDNKNKREDETKMKSIYTNHIQTQSNFNFRLGGKPPLNNNNNNSSSTNN